MHGQVETVAVPGASSPPPMRAHLFVPPGPGGRQRGVNPPPPSVHSIAPGISANLQQNLRVVSTKRCMTVDVQCGLKGFTPKKETTVLVSVQNGCRLEEFERVVFMTLSDELDLVTKILKRQENLEP